MSEKDEYFSEFSKAAKPIADFLTEQLSMTDMDWWDNKVVPYVTDPQNRRLLQFRKLDLLDTQPLLTIYFNNMKEIGDINRMSPLEQQQIKNYICECHSVRNKYAHQRWDLESPAEDLAREFDTLYRICRSVHAPEEFLNELAECRADYLEMAYGIHTSAVKESEKPVEPREITITVESETAMPAAVPYCSMMPQMPMAPVLVMGVQPGMMYGMMMNTFGMRQY